MEEQILSLISAISWPGAIALIGFLVYKSGLFGVISKKFSGTSGNSGNSSSESDKRLLELETFKVEAETNHFHDLNELKSEVKGLSEKLNEIDKRLVRVETRLNGNVK